jgi:hypothetical protein
MRVPTLDGRAALTGQQHPGDVQRATLDLIRDAEPTEDRQRPGVDRVAAELVARERRAIQQEYTRARARQYNPSDRAGGARAHDHHIVHWAIR